MSRRDYVVITSRLPGSSLYEWRVCRGDDPHSAVLQAHIQFSSSIHARLAASAALDLWLKSGGDRPRDDVVERHDER